MSMMSALGALAASGNAGAPPAGPAGPPMKSPQGAPPPTGVGKMPVGNAATPANVEYSSALIWLGAVKNKVAGDNEKSAAIDSMMQTLRDWASGPAAPGPIGANVPPPGPGIGAPPGAPLPGA